MIPAAFEYHAPSTIAEATTLLSKLGEDAKVLSGGQSLIPLMKLRLASPAHLVDINAIPGLAGIREADGFLRIGSLTRESDLEESVIVRTRYPLLHDTSKVIADPLVRNLATVGGNLAHGDPANDQPAICIALDATFVLASPKGEREVKADSFFRGTYDIDLKANEILKEIVVAPFAPNTGYAYAKLKRKTGDWATAATAVVLRVEKGSVADVRIALTNVGPAAIRATKAEDALKGKAPNAATIEAAAKAAMAACDPSGDLRGDREYRTAMAGEMTRRALRTALERAGVRI